MHTVCEDNGDGESLWLGNASNARTMRDVFPDEAADTRSTGVEALGDTEAARIRDRLEGQHVCPFCGLISDKAEVVCSKCSMENSPAARKATKVRIGPWYVLQNRNPAAPGMKWETLLTFISKGRVKPQSIIRGPTTHQLWRFAAHVKGLSREFGICHSCGAAIERDATVCMHCNRMQDPPANPDSLLETSESDAKLPIFKEVQTPEPAPAPAPVVDVESLLSDHRQKLEQSHREQQFALEREREALAQEQEAASRDRERLRQLQESLERDRDRLKQEQAAIERERQAISHERTIVAEPIAPAPPAPATPVAASVPVADEAPADQTPADTAVWDLGEEPGSKAEPAAAPSASTSAPQRPAAAPANQGRSLPPVQIAQARDGFLSAKDLAAAFRLNPPNNFDIAARPTDYDGGGMPSTRRPRGRRVLLAAVIAFLFLCVAVLAIVLNPDWRQRVSLMLDSGNNVSKTPAVPLKEELPPDDFLSPTTVPTTAPAQFPRMTPTTLPSGLPSASTPVMPAAPVNSGVPAADPNPKPATMPQERPIPPGIGIDLSDPRVKPIPAPRPAINAGPSDIQKMDALFKQAKDAEVRQDFAAAVKLLEEIEKFPMPWPGDTDDRLKVNRQQLQLLQNGNR